MTLVYQKKKTIQPLTMRGPQEGESCSKFSNLLPVTIAKQAKNTQQKKRREKSLLFVKFADGLQFNNQHGRLNQIEQINQRAQA